MRSHWKKIIVVLLAIGLLVLVGYARWRYVFPFGNRGCMMTQIMFSLINYADEHEGWYPRSNGDSYTALQLLYSDPYSAYELAGLSGDIENCKRVLKQGGKLDATLSSWVYVQGLRTDDDSNLALLWESKGGLYKCGRRNPSGGHAVLLLSHDTTNVSPADWKNFLAQQETLQTIAFENHKKLKK